MCVRGVFLIPNRHFKLRHQFLLEHPCKRIGNSFHFSGLLQQIEEADLLYLMICQVGAQLGGEKKEAFIQLLM